MVVDVHGQIDHVRGLAAIIRLGQLETQEVNTVGIVGRNLESREIEAADVVGVVVRNFLPVVTQIVADEQRSLADRGLGQRVDTLRITRSDREADPADGARRQSAVQALPGLAAIRRAPTPDPGPPSSSVQAFRVACQVAAKST